MRKANLLIQYYYICILGYLLILNRNKWSMLAMTAEEILFLVRNPKSRLVEGKCVEI